MWKRRIQSDLPTCRPADLPTCRPADLPTCRPADRNVGRFIAAWCAVFLLIGAGSIVPSHAACVSGAQCEANGTTEHPANGANFQAAGTGVLNAAVLARNGGTIVGDSLALSAPNAEEIAVAGWMAGDITLTGNTTITADIGLFTQDSDITMTGGSITANQQAVRMWGDSHVALTDVEIVQNGQTRYAVMTLPEDNGSSFTMTGGSITSEGGGFSLSGSNSEATFSGVAIQNFRGSGMTVASGGLGAKNTLTLNGGTTIYQGTKEGYMSSLPVIQLANSQLFIDDAHIVSTRGAGMQIMGVGSGLGRVDARNFSIQTLSGGFSRDLGIQLSYNAQANLARGSISTVGYMTHGIWVVSYNMTDTLVADELTIDTSGDETSAIYVSSGTVTLSNSHLKSSGAFSRGITSDGATSTINMSDGEFAVESIVHMQGGDITVEGRNGSGVYALSGAQAHLDGVAITGTQTNTTGFYLDDSVGSFKNGTIHTQGNAVDALRAQAVIDIDNSHLTSVGDGFFGIRLRQQASSLSVRNGSTIDASGQGSSGLGFVGATTENRAIVVHDSSVSAMGANGRAIYMDGGINQLDVRNSTLDGDLLMVMARNTTLDIDADNSRLLGHISQSVPSTLTMNLRNGTDWLLRPSSGGLTRSDVSFLNLDNSRIRFAAPDPQNPVFQTLRVGVGNPGGGTNVYSALNNARVEMNTVLNAGGALARQLTDRLIINGDASGTTLLTVNAVAGSPGALTGDTASDGISLVQVYGNASASSFALANGYVPMGPYEYRLYAFDPGTSDPTQRVLGSGAFWDFRLLSGVGRNSDDGGGDSGGGGGGGGDSGGGGGDDSGKTLLPQVPSYLMAPNAIFQARLIDIGMLHQRVGESLPSRSGKRDAFLRTYGGDYDYRSNRSAKQYGYDASTRYHAMQGGGNFYEIEGETSSLRVGLAGSIGDLSFTPRRVDGSHKTRMNMWSISPTVTWQHATDAYVDALVAVGGFRGDVANRIGVATKLQGRSVAASVEAGMPLTVSGLTVKPQVQMVYQRLTFKRLHDADGLAVELGSPSQWSIHAGGEIGKTFHTGAGHRIQLYGKAHVVHSVGDGQTVRMVDRFRLGKSGTVAKLGVGVDVLFAKDRSVVYADLTHQSRISRAGHAGWALNLGARVRF